MSLDSALTQLHVLFVEAYAPFEHQVHGEIHIILNLLRASLGFLMANEGARLPFIGGFQMIEKRQKAKETIFIEVGTSK